ncbi:hypothetical protein NQ315_009706 [Exocentrus adspersus]|uniref:Uncharacterized protein n=1 Tax=Exocentrus adspersus TaxID=1586481 RepID=A0AAV8WGT3_9CUCU|nr:hypothetical protein NQ315_009706 [Exocentrus adspersus]
MDIDVILKQLQNIEDALKCNACNKTCVNPVKIKVCGHYFCSKCFEAKGDLCPKCKIHYEDHEADYENIAKQSYSLLSELKTCLLEGDSKLGNASDVDVKYDDRVHPSGVDNTFIYKSKVYHINYIDEGCSKLNSKGETPLHIACKRKRVDKLKALIEKKTDLNVKDFAGWAPLHEAVESGSVEIVETLLKSGAMVDVPGAEYVTPLHKAVTLENVSLIKILLRYDANRETLDYFGKKPIECSSRVEIKNIFRESIDCDCISRYQEVFCQKKINVYFYYTEELYKRKLGKSKLVKVVKEYDAKKVTHFIIRRTHKLSVKIMTAVLDGCFLLPQEWVDDFLKDNYFIPIHDYTFISHRELNKGIRRAFLNSLLKLPKLFDGINFHILGHNNNIEIYNLKFSKNSICLLITSGGGKILHRAPTTAICENIVNYPYHANINGKLSRCCHYIIYEEKKPPTLQYQMAEIKHRSSKWLVDCIINFTIFD